MAEARYPVEPLTRFTSDLLAAAGLEDEKAQTVARLLVLTDMLGRHTHGVACLLESSSRIVKNVFRSVLKETGIPSLIEVSKLPVAASYTLLLPLIKNRPSTLTTATCGRP